MMAVALAGIREPEHRRVWPQHGASSGAEAAYESARRTIENINLYHCLSGAGKRPRVAVDQVSASTYSRTIR
jgi:hypothetical protein